MSCGCREEIHLTCQNHPSILHHIGYGMRLCACLLPNRSSPSLLGPVPLHSPSLSRRTSFRIHSASRRRTPQVASPPEVLPAGVVPRRAPAAPACPCRRWPRATARANTEGLGESKGLADPTRSVRRATSTERVTPTERVVRTPQGKRKDVKRSLAFGGGKGCGSLEQIPP